MQRNYISLILPMAHAQAKGAAPISTFQNLGFSALVNKGLKYSALTQYRKSASTVTKKSLLRVLSFLFSPIREKPSYVDLQRRDQIKILQSLANNPNLSRMGLQSVVLSSRNRFLNSGEPQFVDLGLIKVGKARGYQLEAKNISSDSIEIRIAAAETISLKIASDPVISLVPRQQKILNLSSGDTKRLNFIFSTNSIGRQTRSIRIESSNGGSFDVILQFTGVSY